MKLAEQPVTTGGRLQLRNMSISFNDTATFKTLVEYEARPDKETTFNASTLNSVNSSLNQISVTSGDYRFGILGEASNVKVTIKNDEYTPCVFQSAEWEGIFNTRNRRI